MQIVARLDLRVHSEQAAGIADEVAGLTNDRLEIEKNVKRRLKKTKKIEREVGGRGEEREGGREGRRKRGREREGKGRRKGKINVMVSSLLALFRTSFFERLIFLGREF